MKRLFIGFVSSCMFIFIIWTIVAYVNFGDNISNVRLDLFSTFTRFGKTLNIQNNVSILELLKNFKSGLEKMLNYSVVGNALNYIGGGISSYPTGFQLLLTVAIGFIEPIWTLLYSVYVLIYAIALIFELVVYVLTFLIAIDEFLFNPVFIPV